MSALELHACTAAHSLIPVKLGGALGQAHYRTATRGAHRMLTFFRDFAFELSHAPFELFNHTIKLLDGSVDVVAENF